MSKYTASATKSTSSDKTFTITATKTTNSAVMVIKVNGDTVASGGTFTWSGAQDASFSIVITVTADNVTTTYTVDLACEYTGD